MEEWKKYKLQELCSIHRGSSPRPIQKFLSAKGQPWVKISDATADSSRYISKTKECIIPEGIKHSVIVEPGTLIVSNSATPGLPKIMKITACVHDGWLIIDNIKPIVLKEFLYYSFILIRRELSNQANGSVFQNLKTEIVKNFEINVPPISIQKRIVSILERIEDKIDINNGINDNLEQQAQALYKSWFTDFEPFKNGKFIESELGLIPEGWKVGKIKDIISLLSGFPFKSSDFVQNGDYRLITIKGVQDGYLDVTSADRLSSFPPKMPEYCILNIGDILISLTGNVGRICIVDRNKLLLNQRVAILAPKDPRDSFYTYTMFRSESFKNELIHLARGTAQLNLSPIETGDKLTVIPPDSVLEAFAKISKGTFDQYISIKMENIRLSEMRDTLLPKLISGELKINEIDC